jgi:hypothetical protein
MSTPNKYQPKTNTLGLIESLLPSTFYADRDLAFRIKMLVENWQRAECFLQFFVDFNIDTGPQAVAQEVSSFPQGAEDGTSSS